MTISLCTLLLVPFAIAGLVDLPRMLRFGGVTMLAVLTLVQVALACAGLIAASSYPKVLLRAFIPFGLFLAWMIGRSAVAPPTQAGVQNGLVYVLFGAQFLLAGTLAASLPSKSVKTIGRGILVLEGLALGLVALGLAAGRAPEAWLIGPRSLGLLAILPVSWHLSRWYYGHTGAGTRALVWIAAVLASFSRMAIAVLLVNAAIVVALQLCTNPSRLVRRAPALVVALVALLLVVASQSAALYDRFFEGYTALEVGTVSIPTSGRTEFWPVVVESALQHPIIGGGLGSSNTALSDFDSAVVAHPHNEYLRIWHDGGLVGLTLMLVAFCRWLSMLVRQWRRATRTRAPFADVELAGLLTLIGILVAALTDNGFIYSFVMGPAGLLIGAAVGLRLLKPSDAAAGTARASAAGQPVAAPREVLGA